MEDREKAVGQLIANASQWQEFVGLRNSKECILRKASALASAVASEAAVSAVGSLQSLGARFGISKTDMRWWDVYYDLLLYFIHIADREAFDFLEDSRGIFVDRLRTEVVRICRGSFKDDRKAGQFEARFLENHNLFQRQFASYQRVTSVPLGEQVDYRFSERIARRLDLGPDFGVLVASICTAAYILLNIPGLLTGKSLTKEKNL